MKKLEKKRSLLGRSCLQYKILLRIFIACQQKTIFGAITGEVKLVLPYLITIEILLGRSSEHIPVAPPEGNGKALPILDEALGGENGGRYK